MKTALVLSGGGTKGSVQLGILKRLYEQGFRPDVIYGTSIGSLNAAGLSYVGIEGTEKLWRSINKMSDIFKFNWWGWWRGLYNAKPLAKILLNMMADKDYLIPAYSCLVSLETGVVRYVGNSRPQRPGYIDATCASASVPVLTEPVNGEWVDGGVREQTPLKKAIDDGADRIVVVLCNPYTENPEPAKVGNIISNLIRTTDILSHEVFRNDIENCLWYNSKLPIGESVEGKRYIQLEVWAPPKQTIGTNDFDHEKIVAGIKYGYENGVRVV